MTGHSIDSGEIFKSKHNLAEFGNPSLREIGKSNSFGPAMGKPFTKVGYEDDEVVQFLDTK